MEKLVNGMRIKDNVLGLIWEVIDEKENKVQLEDGNTIVSLSNDKLNNFSLVSLPNVTKENEIVEKERKINYGLDREGFIIDKETKERVISQGNLRFSYMLKDEQNSKILLSKFSDGDGCDIYVYDIKKDKFNLYQKNSPYYFLSEEIFYKDDKYVVFGYTKTGTYGDFRSAKLFLYNRKKGEFVCSKSINFPLYGKFYLAKKTNSELVFCLFTNDKIGAFASDYAHCSIISIKKDEIILGNRFGIGGSTNKNKIHFSTNSGKVYFSNETHIAVIDLKNQTLLKTLVLDSSILSHFCNLKKLEKITISKNGNMTVIFVNHNDELKTLKTKVTNDRGIVQKVE